MTLVMVHGSGSGRETWHYQSEAFPGSHAVNLPGHPDGDLLPTIPDCARWLHDYVERHALEGVVVAGHSLGGGVALQYALDYPGRVRGLIIVASGARLRVHPQILADLETKVAQRAAFDPMDGLGRIAPEVAAVLARRRLENGLAARLNDMRACDRFDVIERLAEIKVPVLALCGTDDVMTPPKYTEFLGARLPDARALVIEGATHQVHLEKPAIVNAAIAEFLARLA